jgi:elongation factor G
MEKYFSGESFSDEEILSTLKAGVKSGDIAPVFCGSAINHAGVKMLLDAIVDFVPAFSERGTVTAQLNGETVQLNVSENETLSALVFKTIVDPFVGRISYIKVMSGVLNSDSSVYNSKKEKNERIAQLFLIKGKQQINTDIIMPKS